MALVPVDLPSPRRLRDAWAALAGVLASRGWGTACVADRSRWHYDDGGGNWVELHHVGDGRAVLVGHDHEYSDTYFRASAAYFQEPSTDLLAGAPEWWEPPVAATEAAGLWVGFVYGFADGRWQRAAYDVEDGVGSVDLPALSAGSTRERISEFAADSPALTTGPPPAAVAALVAAGVDVTEEQLAAVIGRGEWDVAAGISAARAFALAPIS